MNVLFCYANGFNPENGGVQKVTKLLSNFLSLNGVNVSFLQSATSTYYTSKTFILPKNNFDSKENRLFYEKLLIDLKIDVVINHEATNRNFFFFSRTNKIKHIAVFHQNPMQGIKKESIKGIKALLYNEAKKLKEDFFYIKELSIVMP